ncbi:restriction endonuclease subunit S [Ruminococcus flavefaciens]|uniref:restriction endonuclease subunit S n=1 Tax=Ruminococcus flavefaciens TaxID=1265 RepID=UPI0026EAAE27|nr:restriction endonuclease subunit S [Ruminococcus flavefaciens]
MREMNSTGIVWCPSIPSDWELRRVKDCFYISKVKAGTNNPVVLKLARSGVRVKDVTVNSGQMAESYDDYNPVQVGDLLLNPMDLYSGANCNVSEVEGVISPAYVNLRAKETLNPYYFDYYFKIQYWTMAMFAHGKGVSYDNRWTINAESVKAYELPFPSVSEQNAIVDIIKRKCTQIDALISNAQQQIEKLKAYKQSVITETVTKGLDPDVEMKDSGVEWIGEIPEHWGTPQIKHIATISSGSTPNRNNTEYWNGSIKWLKTGELQNNEITDSEEHITQKALEETSVTLFPVNTVLMAMYGQGKTRGMTALLKTPSTTNQACAGMTVVSQNILVKYFWKCLMGAYNGIREIAQGSGQPNLNAGLISSFIIPLPPKEEQQPIIDYLDHKCTQIDQLIALKQQKIEKLQQYKKSLIYEYVTGKKEV